MLLVRILTSSIAFLLVTLLGNAGAAINNAVQLECTKSPGNAEQCVLVPVRILENERLTSRPHKISNEKWVSLHGSKAAYLPGLLFERFPKMEHLLASDVDMKKFMESGDGSTDSIGAHLRELDLSQNKLTSLRSNAFGSFKRLEILKLQNNSLESFDGSISNANAQLQHLNLSGNVLSRLNWESLEEIRTLEFIDVSSNQLSSICITKFVKTLAAKGNRIERIEVPDNRFFFALERLDVSWNKLSDVATLAKFVKVTHVDLSHNQLLTVDFGLFKNMRYLLELNLAQNRLFTVWTSSAMPITLDLVDLSGNYLTALPAANVTGINSVQRLYLEGNKLIDMEVLEGVRNWPRLKSITLGINDWHCPYIEGALETLKKKNIAVSGDGGICTSGQILKGHICCSESKTPLLDRLVGARMELSMLAQPARTAAIPVAPTTVSPSGVVTSAPVASDGDQSVKLSEQLRKALTVVSYMKVTVADLENEKAQLQKGLDLERQKTTKQEDLWKAEKLRLEASIKRMTEDVTGLRTTLDRSQAEVRTLQEQVQRLSSGTYGRTGQKVLIQ